MTVEQNAKPYQLGILEKIIVKFFSDAKNMARDVRACFLRIFQEVGGLEESGAQTLLKNMEKQRQYQADVWS